MAGAAETMAGAADAVMHTAEDAASTLEGSQRRSRRRPPSQPAQ
jgi:hypothetical protein